MVSALTRIFGMHNLELAEDVVQDTLLKACTEWAYGTIPENPSAWLFTVARNKALDVIRREKYRKEYAADISHLLKSEYTASSVLNELFLDHEIRDDQLRMMFACCHPALPQEAQVAITLRTLCGLSPAEIARAFLSSEDTINKRLYRAREKLRSVRAEFEIPSGSGLSSRLQQVLSAIYLLFNEGYNSTQHDLLIRDDLTDEAIRLAELLAAHPVTARPEVHALLALMLFHASRNKARIGENGAIILLAGQDRSAWNREMIEKAAEHLALSSEGDALSEYHIEAAIAFNHALAPSYAATDWKAILDLYDLLLQHFGSSPIVELNRAIALAQVEGPQAGLSAIENIDEQLENYYLFHATKGDLLFRSEKYKEAKTAFENALKLTHSATEIGFLKERIASCARF
jgi:RNA polymerase sigma factor (sigma-70 family)